MRLVLLFFFAFMALVAGVLALIGRLITRRENIDWEAAERPGKVAMLDDEPIHFIDQGRGPAVVLVHGFGGHTFSFRYLIPELAKDYRVVAVDLLGFGYSGRLKEGDYSLTAQAQRVLGLMDHLGIERAAVVGHSMGGEVVMRMASMAPDRVERLVLAGSVSGDRLPTLPPTPLLIPFLPAIARFTSRLMLRRAVADPAFLTPEVREGYLKPARIRGTMDGLYEILKDTRTDGKIDFARISQPVLLLWAAWERIVPGWTLRRLQKRFPHAQTVTIDDAGHLLLEERPVESLAVIRSFLAAPASRPPWTEAERAPAPATMRAEG